MVKKFLGVFLIFLMAAVANAQETISPTLLAKARENLARSETTARRALTALSDDLSHEEWTAASDEITRLVGEVQKNLDQAEQAVKRGEEETARLSLKASVDPQMRLVGLTTALLFQVGEKTGRKLEELKELLPKKEGI
ncbi:MAG: hypothetical protein HY001_00230 [Candidatus Portnoybacteria bacterium]|nr:hypothetical protein [Candidatus Portnoybacteria bacterium]